MRYNPKIAKVILDSLENIDRTSKRTEQTNARIIASLEAIASLIVAASNYRASTHFIYERIERN